MQFRFLITAGMVCSLAVTTAFGQSRDFRTERLLIDDNNGNTVTIQTSPGPITGGTLTVPDPGGAATFLISSPSASSQSISSDLLPGADNTYDLGSGAERWQDIFLGGNATVGGAIRLQETGGGSDYVGFQAPASVGTNVVWTLPAADGNNGDVLKTDGSGVLSWATGGATGAAGGSLTGTYPNPTIANDAITTSMIQDGQVQNQDISANAVTTSKVANGTVTTSKLADSAVSGLKLLTYAVTNRHLAFNSVTPNKIDPTGATSGNVLTYNGTNVVWGTAGGTVSRNVSLTGDGSPGSPLGINVGNSNTWTSNQTFAGQFLITANARIAMTNSDNNARDIRFQEPSGSGSQYIGLRAPSVQNNGNYVLPAVVGSVGQVLAIQTSNNIDSATLAWATGGATGAAGGSLTGTYPNPTIANDAITTSMIQDGQVQNQDISANAITTSKVANGTVTTSKLADSAVSGLKLLTYAVTNRHLASNSVTLDKINPTGATTGQVIGYDGTNVVWTAGGGGAPTGAAGGSLTGTYPNPTIANDAITTAMILDGQVQNQDIAANAVTTSRVANGTVTTSKLADSAVSGLKLLTYAVTNRHLAASAVTPDKISSSGASTGDVLRYNGTSVAWGAPSAGGMSFNHTVVSATTYTVATTDDILGCDVSSNGITITLPAANSVPAGKTLIICVENGDASVAGRSITINRNGTDLINYAQTSLTINQGTGVPGTAFRLYSDGVNQWWQW